MFKKYLLKTLKDPINIIRILLVVVLVPVLVTLFFGWTGDFIVFNWKHNSIYLLGANTLKFSKVLLNSIIIIGLNITLILIFYIEWKEGKK